MVGKTEAKEMVGKGHESLAAGTWVMVLLVLVGIAALVTAVLVAWPAIAYLASHLAGRG